MNSLKLLITFFVAYVLGMMHGEAIGHREAVRFKAKQKVSANNPEHFTPKEVEYIFQMVSKLPPEDCVEVCINNEGLAKVNATADCLEICHKR